MLGAHRRFVVRSVAKRGFLADNETARPPGGDCRLRVETGLGTSVANSKRQRYLVVGSELFRSFLDSGHVDTVEVSVIPVLLGGDIPLLPPPYNPAKLRLLSHKVFHSGTVSLAYAVQR